MDFHVPLSFPVAVSTIALFVSYLFNRDLSAKSITSMLSAVSYFHKLHNVVDPTSSFLIKKLIAGASRLRPTGDIRLPLTLEVIHFLEIYDRQSLPECFI